MPELIRGRCDQFTSADKIKAFIWRSYGTSAFLTKGMEEILKKTCKFERMEDFISQTIPNILKIESALKIILCVGKIRTGRGQHEGVEHGYARYGVQCVKHTGNENG